MNKLLAVFSAVLVLILTGCQSTQPNIDTSALGSVSGTLSYRERIALPSDALVTITLQEISLADAPAKVIAKHRFMTNGEQVPFKFDLDYHSNKIKPQHRYSVSARIEVNGKLRFITDTIHSVITDNNETSHVDLRLIAVSG